MTLTEYLTLARAFNHEIRNINEFPDATLTTILNNCGVDIAKHGLFLSDDETFNVVADQANYLTSDISTNFLVPHESGIYWNSGTTASPVWVQLDPVTKKYLDEHIPTWRTASSASPIYYYLEANTISFYPAPETSLDDGFKAYFYRKASPMSSGGHYAFEGSTEIPSLIIFDTSFQKYLEWRVSKILGKDPTIQTAYEQEYIRDRSINLALLNRRPDIVNSKKARMKTQRMPTRF